MDKRTRGAWLLAHSKLLDHFAGPGALRLENIAYAGKVGRLHNVLRQGSDEARSVVINSQTVARLCHLNGIDLASRRDGLRRLSEAGRIDVSADGSVAVLGATSAIVLETAADIFASSGAPTDEHAVISLSEAVARRPVGRRDAEEQIGDEFRLKEAHASELIEVCKRTAIVDEEGGHGRGILFNSNTFRDGERARKAYLVLQALEPAENARLTEIEELLQKRGAIADTDAEAILGSILYNRLASVGYFDRMEVNNPDESVGYLALPNAFQRYGRPFEEDPVDDAKALLASLTYGMTRSSPGRGRIESPRQLLNSLIAGNEIGGQLGATAIGEDYQELERRGVVHVKPVSRTRFRMRLLKPDVGQLAKAVLVGGRPAEEVVLLGGRPATGFKGPDENRREVRRKNTAQDRAFVESALEQIRGGD